MFLIIHIYFIILKTHDQQFTLTTKKSLLIVFNVRGAWFTNQMPVADENGAVDI